MLAKWAKLGELAREVIARNRWAGLIHRGFSMRRAVEQARILCAGPGFAAASLGPAVRGFPTTYWAAAPSRRGGSGSLQQFSGPHWGGGW